MCDKRAPLFQPEFNSIVRVLENAIITYQHTAERVPIAHNSIMERIEVYKWFVFADFGAKKKDKCK